MKTISRKLCAVILITIGLIPLMPASSPASCITIDCSNIVVTTSCSNCVMVDYNATARDTCCTNKITLTYYPPATNCFKVGTNWAEAIASDECGNTATDYFSVTVIEETNPPVIHCPSIILVKSTTNSFGPNLVPNPGFETYSSCPTAMGQISLATPWFSVNTATPDYYNACAGNNAFISVPYNYYTLPRQGISPHGGQAYAGIIAMDNIAEQGNSEPQAEQVVRTYPEVKLTSPLKAGQAYQVGFYASLAPLSDCGIDNLGAYLSAKKENQLNEGGNGAQQLGVNPQVRNPAGSFLFYTNWTLVEGVYTATGGESYLTIGNFYNNAGTPTKLTVGPGSSRGNPGPIRFAYYFIDGVSVAEVNSGYNFTTNFPVNAEGNRFVVTSCSNAQVFYGATASSSACSDVTVNCTPPSGSTFAPNTTNVVECVAKDCCGNTSTCSFTVVVLPGGCN
jgi:hypothetical protein